jgi:hypothetical protein
MKRNWGKGKNWEPKLPPEVQEAQRVIARHQQAEAQRKREEFQQVAPVFLGLLCRVFGLGGVRKI